MLGGYIFTIVIFSSSIDLLIIMQCPSLSLVTVFILNLFCLIWVLLLQLSFDLHLHETPFSIPSISVFMCAYILCGSSVNGIYVGLIFVPIQQVCVFVGAFNAFIVKVIIDIYVIAILLIVLVCSGRSFSFPPYLVLSSFDLMIMFSIMFGFVCVCLCLL